MTSDTTLIDCLFETRASTGMIGTTGTIGWILPGRRPFAFGFVADSGRDRCCGITAEEGVVGCVESASEGALDVVGVADEEEGGGSFKAG